MAARRRPSNARTLRAQIRLLRRLERRNAVTIRAALRRQNAAAVDALRKGGEKAAVAALTKASIATMRPALLQSQGLAARSFGVLARSQMPQEPKAETAEQTYQQIIDKYLRGASLEAAKHLRSESVRELRGMIRTAIAEGIGPRQLATRIDKLLRVRSSTRARAIARTETHNAAMAASNARADASTLKLEKGWLTNVDGRERRGHREMNGKRVPHKGKFEVGRAEGGVDRMTGPGDTSASAGNLVNCRCGLQWHEVGSTFRPGQPRGRRRR